MFINKLKAIKSPITQAALVSAMRTKKHNQIMRESNPNKLNKLAVNIYKKSKLHKAANPL